MIKYYMGVDIGSISTKAVIIDQNGNIIDSEYIWTEGSPINSVKKIIKQFRKNFNNNLDLYGIGTTGSGRNLIGSILGANVIKNEITAHAIGTLSKYPDVRTIFEIGGQDSKIIIIKNQIVVDYAMNTLCAAGTGAFLSSQAKRLGIEIEKLGDIAKASNNPAKIAARCTVFAESDLVHKAQIGYNKEDIVAGICNAVAQNYLNNLARGKNIEERIVFQGGVSKNVGVVNAFEHILKKRVFVDKNSHLMGALGVAIIAKQKSDNVKIEFNFEDYEKDIKTIGKECRGCNNNCEIINIYKNNELIDRIGGRCEKGNMMPNKVKLKLVR